MVVLWLHCVNGTCRSEVQHIPKTHGKCGAPLWSSRPQSFHYTLLCLLQWLSFICSLKQQCWLQRYRAPLSLLYFLLDSTSHRHWQWHPDTSYIKIVSGGIVKSCFSLEERKPSLQLNWRELRECPDGPVCVNVEPWKCWRNAKRAMNSSDEWFSLWVKPE